MNKETLENYRNLNFEIYKLERRIKKLETSKVAHDRVTASNSEFPYQAITVEIEGVADNSERINRLKNILKVRKKKAEEQQLEIEEFISNIFDSRLRLIFEMRYIDNKSWMSISRKFGSCHESYARKLHNRYLKEVGK